MGTPITVAYGDGIGPEIMESTLKILEAAGADISPETIEIGKKQYEAGHSTGIGPEAWDSLHKTKVLLKAPITTPQGGGYKSLNVTIRKTLGLYANVRPCISYYPFVTTSNRELDIVIVRENEEDLYTGIEHRQTNDVYQCLKLISRPGCERIVEYAFDYAVRNNRRKVSCFSKDNIMKMTDGLFHKVFDEIAAKYPEIESEHYIIDIGSARLASRPQIFDVVVTLNLYGDIISDIAAEISGSVGLAGSSNVGDKYAMFEAIHGSAPDIAGQNIANPSGLVNGAVMMLVHIGQNDKATLIHNALLKTIEDGIHTADIWGPDTSKEKVGTKEFTEAVISRLGQQPYKLRPVAYDQNTDAGKNKERKGAEAKTEAKELVGIDVFADIKDKKPDEVGEIAKSATPAGLEIKMLSNRGLKVWPGDVGAEISYDDHWRMRFLSKDGSTTHAVLTELLSNFAKSGIDFIKVENLYNFDGKPGYSMAQGE